MKLTYWRAGCLTDSTIYSVRAKTKKECVALLATKRARDYGAVEKITIEYRDAFALAQELLSENHYCY